MRGLSFCLVLTESCHNPVIELLNPLGKDDGPVGTRDIERGSPSHIALISLGAFRVLDFVVFDMSFKRFDLDM